MTALYDRQAGVIRQGRGEKVPQGHALPGRWWLLALPLAIVAALVGVTWFAPDDRDDIVGTHLAGARGPEPVNFVFLMDRSGSFVAYDQVREEALRQVLTWAPRNLRDDDTLTVITFADDAVLTLPWTTVGQINSGTAVSQAAPNPSGTRIVPALEMANHQLPAAANTSVVALTDTAIYDGSDPRIASLLGDLDVATISVLIPDGTPIEPSWATAFPNQVVFNVDSTDTSAVSLAFGQAVAHGTGQQLNANQWYDNLADWFSRLWS